MQRQRFETPESFHQPIESYLLAREAEHNLLVSIVSQLLQNPEMFREAPYLATVDQGDGILAVGLRTPPWPLQLSQVQDMDAIPLLVNDVHDVYGDTLSGVNGPSEVTKIFVDQYRRLSGQSYRLKVGQRVFRLSAVTPVTGVSGNLRKIAQADRPVLQVWLPAFFQEALHEERSPDAVKRAIDHYLGRKDQRGIYLWVDGGEAVSMAIAVGPTPHGIRIIDVYTPPEKRRKGYASACVAGLSQHLLDSGRKFCFLETDLSNPTSNHIYQEVGYRPVCDMDEYKLSDK